MERSSDAVSASVGSGAIAARRGEPRRPKRPYLVPGVLETSEIEAVVKAFEWAAKNDQAAGFDGVELHGANVCLLHQFRQDGSNQETTDMADHSTITSG